MIREIITVGLGGAAGSIVRYLVSYGLLAGHTLLGFPAGTFTVNAAGSLVIGFLLALAPSASAEKVEKVVNHRHHNCSSWGSAEGSPPSRPFRPMPCGCSAPATTDRRPPTWP